MTDNEIIKALECCSDDENYKCNECPLYVDCEKTSIAEYALVIINRQKAEIERLKHILVSFMSEVENWEHKYGVDTSNIPKIAVLGTEKENRIKQTKSEAYREFAERLKKLDVNTRYLYSSIVYELGEDDIDNLVKEMAEE